MKGIGLLEQAYALEGMLHHSGIRGKYRTLLEQGIVLISKGLESTCDSSESARVRKLLVQAHAARAEDARYGVGALSRSAQRAPTLKDCEEGWQKVAMIVDQTRESADEARRLANKVGDFRTEKLAERAERAAPPPLVALAQERSLEQRMCHRQVQNADRAWVGHGD